MAGLGNLTTTLIITGGMTGDHAPVDPCKHGIITTAFSLYCTGTPPVIPSKGGGGGGYYPHDAWNRIDSGDVASFYKPVPENLQYYVVPRDQEANFFRRNKLIKLSVTLAGKTMEHEYSVSEKKAKIAIKVLNILDVTVSNINVTITNIKRFAIDAVIKVKNLKRTK